MDHRTNTAKQRRREIARHILAWYDKHQRDLPWRRTDEPYHIWVSEVMLQQTQVDTVIPYYRRFLGRFPTVQALAEARLDHVLKVWENLGYYARARHLHEAAKQIMDRFHGCIPNEWEALVSLPGVGTYTAGAILSIAFGERRAAVDANIRRVLARLFAIVEPLGDAGTVRRIAAIAQGLVPRRSPGHFNQGLMDLGATICTPQNPACVRCPVKQCCKAFETNLQDTLPVMKKRPPIPHRDLTAGVIQDKKGRLLVVQRIEKGLLGGLWKLPGGTRKPDETLEACLCREVEQAVGLHVAVGVPVVVVKHAYTHFRITLHAFHCRIRNGRPRKKGCAAWQWTNRKNLDKLAFSKADQKVLQALE